MISTEIGYVLNVNKKILRKYVKNVDIKYLISNPTLWKRQY